MMDLYILDERGELMLEPDLGRWGAWMSSPHARRVAWTEIGDWTVSTVFLGVDHSFGQGERVLWETMVFGPEPWTDTQWRYSSRHAALAQHDQIAEHVRRGGQPDDLS